MNKKIVKTFKLGGREVTLTTGVVAEQADSAVLARMGERVSTDSFVGGYGNYLVIHHDNGVKSFYAHLEKIDVQEGDLVTQGQMIGTMGNTGRVKGATGIHLHFGMSKDGVYFNPMDYFKNENK